MRVVLVLLLTACAGVRGATLHADRQVAADYCANHLCPVPPQVEPLGDGCYRVEHVLYECTVDKLPVGQLMCMQASCGGECTITVEISDGGGLYSPGAFREVGPSKRCLAR